MCKDTKYQKSQQLTKGAIGFWSLEFRKEKSTKNEQINHDFQIRQKVIFSRNMCPIHIFVAHPKAADKQGR